MTDPREVPIPDKPIHTVDAEPETKPHASEKNTDEE